MERAGLEVRDEDIGDLEPAVRRSGGGVVLIDLEPQRVRGQRGEPEHEGPRAGRVGELGGDGAVRGDDEGAGSEGERRVERVRGAGPSALAEGRLVAVAELVPLPRARGGGGRDEEQQEEKRRG